MRIAVVTGVVAVVVVGLIPQMHETGRITKFRLLGSSYHALERLDELTRTHGDGAVVYSGLERSARRTGSFQNTYRAFALPLAQSFDRAVFGIPTEHKARDVTYKPAGALGELQRNGEHVGLPRAPAVPRAAAAVPRHGPLRVRRHRHVRGPRSSSRARTPPDVPWKVAVFHFDVYRCSSQALSGGPDGRADRTP